MPHEYVPWSDARNFPASSRTGSPGSRAVQSAASQDRLGREPAHRDNSPAYHHETPPSSPVRRLGTWVHRWTAEENRHGIVMRGLPPRLPPPSTRTSSERFRMTHMSAATESDNGHSMLHTVAYVAFQELATRSRTATPATTRATRSATACWRGSRPTRTAHGLLPQPHGRGLRARPPT